MNIKIETLSSFIAAAEYGSFSAAARQLNKTQAAVSLTIQNFEIDLGFQVFDRSSKCPRLTEKGEHVLKNAKIMMAQYQTFLERSLSIYHMNDVKIKVGIDPLVCNDKILSIIKKLSSDLPNIELFIMQQNSKRLAEEIKAKNLDIALGIFDHENKMNLEYTQAFNINVSWVATQSYLDKFNDGATTLSYQDFCQQRLLIPASLDSLPFEEAKAALQLWHVEDIHTILSLCREDIGICCLPDFVLQHDLKNKLVQKLNLSFSKITSNVWSASLIYPIGSQLSPAIHWLQGQFTSIESF